MVEVDASTEIGLLSAGTYQADGNTTGGQKMQVATIVLRIPFGDEPTITEQDAHNILTSIRERGYATDPDIARDRFVPYVSEEGVSLDGVTNAVLNMKGH